MKKLFLILFVLAGYFFLSGTINNVSAVYCNGLPVCGSASYFCSGNDIYYDILCDSGGPYYATTCPAGYTCRAVDYCTTGGVDCIPDGATQCLNDNDCPGCQACNTGTGACYDSNAYCSAGQVCSNAVCTGGGCSGLQCANGCFDTSSCLPPNSPACGSDGNAYCYPPAPPPPPPIGTEFCNWGNCSSPGDRRCGTDAGTANSTQTCNSVDVNPPDGFSDNCWSEPVACSAGTTCSNGVCSAATSADVRANNSNGPITVTAGSSVTISWSSTNTATCTGTGFNTGFATSGSTSVVVNSSTTYQLNCNSAVGPNAADSVTVNTSASPPPPGGAVNVMSSPVTGVPISSVSYPGTTNYTIPNTGGIAGLLSAPSTFGTRTFLNWTGCDSVNGNVCSFNVSGGQSQTVTANYSGSPPPGPPPPPPPPPTYSMSGKVYIDSNANGVQNCSGACDNGAGDELNYSGATVTRSGGFGGGTSTTTNSSGNYTLSGTSGSYTITLTVPSGYAGTTPTSINTSVPPAKSGLNFGIQPTYNITGKVFVDANANGVQDCSGACNNGAGDELNYQGATVRRSGTAGGATNASTNSSGNYTLSGTPGSYTITLTVPSGYLATTSTTLNASVPPAASGLNFGIQQTYSITGKVYVDANGNGVQDCNFLCNNGAGDELNYSGATVRRTPGGTTTTNASGNYTFSGLTAGSYTITLTLPSGYIATTTNPVVRTVGPNGTVNFGINTAPPTCTSVDPNPSTVPSDGSSTITAAGCGPNPTYSWPPPETVPPGGEAGSNTNGSTSSTTYNAPDSVCSDTTVRQSVNVTNANGTNTYSTDITITPRQAVSGAVYRDAQGNNCASGAVPFGAGAVLTLYDGGSPTGNDTTDGSGGYLIADTNACGPRNLAVSSVSGYTVESVRVNNGAWTSDGLSGFTYAIDNLNDDTNIDFCISNITPWFQTTSGDVRMTFISNRVPSGNHASSDASNPSVFYSSNFASDFGTGQAAQGGRIWSVDDEYSYRENSKNRNGTISYSFFASRIAQTDTPTGGVPGCGEGSCTVDLTNLPTGVYTHNGDLTISSYTQASGAHVLLLINGNIAVNSNITVPTGQGNLLILASKRDIIIGGNVGSPAPGANPAAHIQGILSAEGNVILASSVSANNASCDTNSPDPQLGIQGSVIANALKPFSSAGSGSLSIRRSLCANDASYPVLKVYPRLDFVTQLSDFYKTSYTRWRELEP